MALIKVAGISMILVVLNALIKGYEELSLNDRSISDVTDYDKLCLIRREFEDIILRIEKNKE